MRKQLVKTFTKPASADYGRLGVPHLREFWEQALAKRSGQVISSSAKSWRNDNLLLNGLGLPLQETTRYLMHTAPSLAEFEDWVLARNDGQLTALQVSRLRSVFAGQHHDEQVAAQLRAIEDSPNVLSADDLRCWDENGYVILRRAISREQAQATEAAVWAELGMSPHDPASWYAKPIGQGMMMDFYHHPTLRANRRSPRIHKAFAQLWNTADLWATTDRTSLNPPETATYRHQGTPLHWDMSLHPPFHFGTQGLIYLCDTPAHQGAFSCVPGFHRQLEAWLASLPAGTDPRRVDLTALVKPIAAKAGDMVIWHHFLPHGSTPNCGTYPRVVQYLNMYPLEFKENVEWL